MWLWRRERRRYRRKQTAFELSIRSQEPGNQSQRASDGAATASRASTSCRTSPLALFSLPPPCRSRHLLVLSTFRLSSNIHSVQEVSCFSQVFAKFREGLRTGSPPSSSSSSSALRSLSCLLSLTQHTYTRTTKILLLLLLACCSPRNLATKRERERKRSARHAR